MAGAGAGAGFGAGLGIDGIGGIGGNVILILNRLRPLLVHPSAELEIIPMINNTIKTDANFTILTLKENPPVQMIRQSTTKR